MKDYNELKNKKLFLLDMDGTIYLDNKLFNNSLNFLDYIRKIGGKFVFLTNNSSKSVNDYIEKLRRFSIKVDETNFLTSSQATVFHLHDHYENKKLYVLGTESLKKELREQNILITDRYETDIDCLVVGFDTELTYNKLIDACKLLNQGVDFIATNPDLVCPTAFGFIPDCGSICEIIGNATGKKPLYIGKPNANMVELALKNSEFSKEQTIVIGDRLYTDIACGINAGVSTAVVLTGETIAKDIETTSFKPDYVFENINELYNILLSLNHFSVAAYE